MLLTRIGREIVRSPEEPPLSIQHSSSPHQPCNLAMDVDEFDDIFSFHWHNQSNALSNVSIEFPVELSTVEIFLNDILDINEDITVETCEDSAPVNKVASFPILQIEATDRARQSPVGSDSGLEWIPPITCDDVVLLPTSINASVTTCVSNDDFRGQHGSCVTEETSPPAKVRKKQSSAARVSRKKIKTNDSQKPMKQIHSRDSNRLPAPEEHILRERKRRDEMAEKFKLLKEILPPQARVSIPAVLVNCSFRIWSQFLHAGLQLHRSAI